jgi:hypothetical protein
VTPREPGAGGPGYQGSHAHGCEVVLYPHQKDPILVAPQIPDRLVLSGRNERSRFASVVSVATDKQLGAPDGSWTITLKEPVIPGVPSLAQAIADDDWIDISFTVNSKKYHTMRGVVESYSSQESVSSTGATVRTISLVGKDFGALFAKTPVWINQLVGEDISLDILDWFETGATAPTPDVAFVTLLTGFLKTQTGLAKSNFEMPPGIPDRSDDVLDRIRFVTEGFDPKPERRCKDIFMCDPTESKLWTFAAEYSDPLFCEAWCDLVPDSAKPYFDEDEEIDVGSSKMGVFFRTRPFLRFSAPTSDPSTLGTRLWGRVAGYNVATQDVVSLTLGRGGGERFNAFFVASDLVDADAKLLVPPLWDEADVKRHGMRPFTVRSSYFPTNGDPLLLGEFRWIVMNFHALNPYLLNGTATLAMLRPDIRVGGKVRIADTTFYVEQVSHSWTLGKGRTTLGLTRGWEGTDASYLAALATKVALYSALPGTGDTVNTFGEKP